LKNKEIKIARRYQPNADVILFEGYRLDLMKSLPNRSVKLVHSFSHIIA